MRSPALAAYLGLSRLAAPLARPLLRRRLLRGKEDASRWPERLGHPGLPRPDGRLAWLHAASVGEANSAVPLVDALRARGLAVLVTTGTVTSAGRMATALPEGALHQFVPVDTAPAVARFLDHWRPDLAVWIESELWPRLLVETAARGVPMALVNARLSARSARRWQRLPGMARRLLNSFRLVLAQDQDTVARVRALGGDARFAGNLKALVGPPPGNEADLTALRTALAGRPVWLGASTHPGEEEIVLAAHAALLGRTPAFAAAGKPCHQPGAAPAAGALPAGALPAPIGSPADHGGNGTPAARLRDEADAGWTARPAVAGATGAPAAVARGSGRVGDPASAPPGDNAAAAADALATSGSAARSPLHDNGPADARLRPLLVLAPRHPGRGDAVARLIGQSGLRWARRSTGEAPDAATDVLLADTLGEMGLWYRLAQVALVGGSLVPVGGHTPFEPVQLDCAVLHGPHVANFAPTYAALDAARAAAEVGGADALAAAVQTLLADPASAGAMRSRARAVHAALRPDLDAIAGALLALMETT